LGIANVADVPTHTADHNAGKSNLHGCFHAYQYFVFHNYSPVFEFAVSHWLAPLFCGLIGLYFFNGEILQEICDVKIGGFLSVAVEVMAPSPT
jgi:hypothetical protein